MKTHSQGAITVANAPRGFHEAWSRLVGPEPMPAPVRRGRKPRVALTQVLSALTFHVMKGPGTLAEHFVDLFDTPIADSSLANRRARLPWEIFAEVMRRVLRPQATRDGQPSAFWRDWRLAAFDGTDFSLTNTPQNNRQLRKARARRGRAAFAKLKSVVLLEIGLHNPLAAAIGRNGECEWNLALTLLAQLPATALVLADRLYGNAPFAAQLGAACQRVGSHFLVRAQKTKQGRTLKGLRDGSRLRELPVNPPYRPTPESATVVVREIRVRVGRRGHRATVVRLWTSLLEPRQAPALELAQLYAQRWEQELYFREVKHTLRRTDLLQSHTVETAAQEIAAIVLASAVLAVERTRAGDGQLPVLRVSFAKMLPVVEAMWFALDVAAPVLTEPQKQYIVDQCYERIRRHVTPERRPRSCPRKVRKPVSGWPRLMKNQSTEGPFEFTIV